MAQMSTDKLLKNLCSSESPACGRQVCEGFFLVPADNAEKVADI
jgi:hypothetical protein